MESEIYRILYCSRNRIGDEKENARSEIERILETSRVNNSRREITGALLFTGNVFAQVLEGPMGDVEQVFETIQMDPRHDGVTVLESGMAPERLFPEWAMAFAGGEATETFAGAPDAFEEAFARRSEGGHRVLTLLREVIERHEEWVF